MVIHGFKGNYNNVSFGAQVRQMNFNVAGTDNEKTDKTPIVDCQWRTEKLRKLSEITDDNEKMKIAVKAYSSMQANILRRINSAQGKIDSYYKLKDEIAYYNDLLKDAKGDTEFEYEGKHYIEKEKICVENPMYDLAFDDGTKGPHEVYRERIEEELKEAEWAYQELVTPDKTSELNARSLRANFRNSAADFAAVTGMSSEFLNFTEEEFAFEKDEGLTHDNLVEKTEDMIKKLKAKSNGLYTLMTEYKRKEGMSNTDGLFDFIENYKFKALEEIRKQILMNNRHDGTERTASLLRSM